MIIVPSTRNSTSGVYPEYRSDRLRLEVTNVLKWGISIWMIPMDMIKENNTSNAVSRINCFCIPCFDSPDMS